MGKRILLSDLLGSAGYSVEDIRIIEMDSVLIASVRYMSGGYYGAFPVYPSRHGVSLFVFPEGGYLDAVLEGRVCEETGEAYYCWEKLSSGKFSFSVSGEKYVPSEPLLNIMTYPSSLVNGGLIR